MAIKFANQGIKSNLAYKTIVQKFIGNQIMQTCNKKSALQYVFVTDDSLLEMNQQFLAHNTFTDIITFDLSEKHNKIDGEIYISIDRVTENASKFAVDYQLELLRVIFHGALHLCGYKDKTSLQKVEMRSKENEWLQAWQIYIVDNS